MRALVGSAVRAAGHDLVAEASDCEAAEAMLARSTPDVLILDSRLPGAGIRPTVTRLLAASPATAIVVLAALRERDVVAAAIEAGAHGALPRPFKASALADVLSDLRRPKASGADS